MPILQFFRQIKELFNLFPVNNESQSCIVFELLAGKVRQSFDWIQKIPLADAIQALRNHYGLPDHDKTMALNLHTRTQDVNEKVIHGSLPCAQYEMIWIDRLKKINY